MSPGTKPELTLHKLPSADDIAKLYERITGKKITPEERVEVERIMMQRDEPK